MRKVRIAVLPEEAFQASHGRGCPLDFHMLHSIVPHED